MALPPKKKERVQILQQLLPPPQTQLLKVVRSPGLKQNPLEEPPIGPFGKLPEKKQAPLRPQPPPLKAELQIRHLLEKDLFLGQPHGHELLSGPLPGLVDRAELQVGPEEEVERLPPPLTQERKQLRRWAPVHGQRRPLRAQP